MRYVVTGGSGFIGSHLVKKLQEFDNEILVIDRLSNHSNLNNINNVAGTKYYFADISDHEITSKLIQDGDIVFHLAAQSHVDVSFQNPLATTRSNVLGTQNIINSCLKNNSKKLIIMSTDEVYGSVQSISNPNLLDPTNPYSASKAAADMIANSYRHMYQDFNFVTLRSNNIFGTGQFVRNIIPRFSCLGILGKKMTIHGDGSATRRYLWVEDAIDALIKLAFNNTNRNIYNIGHDISYSNLEVAQLIGKYLNLEDYISLQEDRVFNDTVYPCDYSDIKSELGWSFTRSLEDELPAVIEWYRDRIDQYKLFL
jgi:dTDP-glucose 4,6-dehydratase